MSKQLNFFLSKYRNPELKENLKGRRAAIINLIGADNSYISPADMMKIDVLDLSPYEKVGEIIKAVRKDKKYQHGYHFNTFLALKFNEYVAMANLDKINSLEDLCRVLSDNRVDTKKPTGSQLYQFNKTGKEKIEPMEAEAKIDSFVVFANEIRVKTTKVFDTRFVKNLYLFDQAVSEPANIKRAYHKVVSNDLNSLPEVFSFREQVGKMICNLINPQLNHPVPRSRIAPR